MHFQQAEPGWQYPLIVVLAWDALQCSLFLDP
jgi:hypothetical protein